MISNPPKKAARKRRTARTAVQGRSLFPGLDFSWLFCLETGVSGDLLSISPTDLQKTHHPFHAEAKNVVSACQEVRYYILGAALSRSRRHVMTCFVTIH